LFVGANATSTAGKLSESRVQGSRVRHQATRWIATRSDDGVAKEVKTGKPVKTPQATAFSP
jgi:hypothetical protein